MGRLNLFDDDGDSSNEDISKIEVDQNYAKRLEHNKKREELQRYEELKKQGKINDSDSEESSEEFEELFKPSKKFDSKFFDALIKVKNKDPILKDKDAKLFDSDSESGSSSDDESEEKERADKKKKPMYLKDVASKLLIEEGPEFNDEDNGKKVKSYFEEQEENKNDLLKKLEEADVDDDGEDLFKVKDTGVEDEEEEDEVGEKLDKVFGEDGKLDENDKFLKDFFRHQMWIGDEKSMDTGEENVELSEDEKAVEKQEDYERDFNFRFEENAGDRVMGHSRVVDGSVRKKANARKSQRERKEERMAQAEFERQEELKRLKNLKKKEINEKLEKIKKVAGLTKDRDFTLDEDDLEEEFDPEEHDRKMKEAFGDEYYEDADIDPAFASESDDDDNGEVPEKPDFDKEDEELGIIENGEELENIENGEELENIENREDLMDEYYKLDYEDTIGDLKTRFKYKKVPSNRFGLKAQDILLVDDKELNQYVPLKKLAPYNDGWKVPRVKTLQFKEKIYEQLREEASRSRNKHRKNRDGDSKAVDLVEDKESGPIEKRKELHDGETSKKRKKDSKAVKEDEGSNAKEVKDETTELSRRAKRRRRQNELKLSQSRLMAYGKIPSK